MDWLKKILGEELYKQVTEKLGDVKIMQDDGTLIKNDGSYIKKEGMIPKARLDEVLAENKELKASATKMEKDLEELKKIEPEKLKARIEELETENKGITEKAENEKRELIKSNKIDQKLADLKVGDEYRDFIKIKINHEKLVLSKDGDTLAGLDEQLTELQTKHPSFFGEKQTAGTDYTPGGNGDPKTFTREQVAKMTQKEVNDNYEAIEKSMEKW